MVQTIYDIVKVHGGELKGESKDDKGATFTISMLIKNE